MFGSDRGPNRLTARLNPHVEAAKIRAIFVHPAWARRGIGSQILAKCEAAARQAGFDRVDMGSTLTGVPLHVLKGYLCAEQVDVALPMGRFTLWLACGNRRSLKNSGTPVSNRDSSLYRLPTTKTSLLTWACSGVTSLAAAKSCVLRKLRNRNATRCQTLT